MDITATTREPALGNDACRIVGVYSSGPLPKRARSLDKTSGGALSRAVEAGDFSSKIAETLVLHDVAGLEGSRVLLVGLGQRSATRSAANAGSFATDSESSVKNILDATSAALLSTGTRIATTDLPELLAVDGQDVSGIAAQLARSITTSAWRFSGHQRQNPTARPKLERLIMVTRRENRDAMDLAIPRGVAIGHGVNRARHLGDLAPNICTPEYLADLANELADAHASLSTQVLDEAQLQAEGMGAMLAVARGSRLPPRLIVMQWRGAKRRGPPLVLVGKGVTFDSGGISIKNSASMDEMKYDMCGAAAVFGVMEACCRLELELDVVGVVAAVENMPDGNATRPGDVITSRSGQTIEILNTDAEGRLVLADALHWAEHLAPRAIVDIATLTGACVVALGDVASGLFGKDAALNQALEIAGKAANDLVWPMPMLPAYQHQLDSNFADLANIGSKGAGAITAACFLSRFVPKNCPWVHLDIAGTAWLTGKHKGATGRPVPMLMQWLIGEAETGRKAPVKSKTQSKTRSKTRSKRSNGTSSGKHDAAAR